MAISTNNPDNNFSGKPLKSEGYDPVLGSVATKIDQEVPHDTDPTALAYGTLLSETVNERNTQKSRYKKVSGTPANVIDKDTIVFSGLQKFICTSTTTKKVMPAGTNSEEGFLVVGSTVKQLNTANFLRETTTTTGFEARASVELDEDGNTITITETVVAPGTSLPASTDTVIYTQAEVDCQHTIQRAETRSTNKTTYGLECDSETCLEVSTTKTRIVGTPSLALAQSNLDCVPGTSTRIVQQKNTLVKEVRELLGWDTWEREFYTTQPFTFPSYLLADNIVPSSWFITPQGRSEFSLTLDVRWGFTRNVSVRVVDSLLPADPTVAVPTPTPTDSVFSPQLADVLFQGRLFSLQLQNLLLDPFLLEATTHIDDTYYGSLAVESLTVGGTPFTAQDYVDAVETEVCISDERRPWNYCLLWRRRMYVYLE